MSSREKREEKDPSAPLDPAKALTQGGQFQLADGRWMNVSRSRMEDGGLLLIFTDVTEIKEREQKYREAKKNSEAANAARTRFLANISHELRTPLNAIIGFSEILSTRAYGPLGNSKYLDYACHIHESGLHLLDLINNVLDMAKGDAGKLQVFVDAVDLDEILASCMRLTEEQCRRARLSLDYIPIGKSLCVMGDAVKLKQVFLNLLSNAVKFTLPGGRISVGVRPTEDQHAVVTIADTGIGMAPADIPIALTPFEQVDNKFARRYQGTGLGLPIAKALVELQGGSIDIASELGKGTAVMVSLRCSV
jgi:signal transduction histidine kinase